MVLGVTGNRKGWAIFHNQILETETIVGSESTQYLFTNFVVFPPIKEYLCNPLLDLGVGTLRFCSLEYVSTIWGLHKRYQQTYSHVSFWFLTGIYCGPLRLLAWEVAKRLNKAKVPCDLLTGQERDEIDGAKHISATVEMADVASNYDCAIIDEIQVCWLLIRPYQRTQITYQVKNIVLEIRNEDDISLWICCYQV